MAANIKVKVSGSLYLPWILVKEKEKLNTKFTAMISVKAPPSVHSDALIPIHLVVVVDVWKGTIDDLLKTMKFISGVFNEDADKDQICVVDACEFKNKKLTIIDSWITHARENQINYVPESGTDLRLLLGRAVEILDNKSDGAKRAGFILLLSDGGSQQKFDDSSMNELFKVLGSKYPVHIFDLDSRHDPEMLHCIAKRSRGTYSSIDNSNNNNKLMEAVAICLGGLKSVVAINTRVRMSVKRDDTNPDSESNISSHFKIKIQPGDHDISGSKEGFLVGDGVLYAGEVKDLIVDINFSTICISSRTRSATLTATVEYEDSSSSLKQAAKCILRLLVTGTHNVPAMTAYKEWEQLLPNSMVLQRMIMLEVLEKLIDATTTKTAKKQMTGKKITTGEELRSMWRNLKKDGEYLKKVVAKNEENSDLLDLQWIDNDIEAMASCLDEKGLGLGHIYSWVSRYQMQRATTTGLPQPTKTPFLTLDMEKMVDRAKNYELPIQEQEDAGETGRKNDAPQLKAVSEEEPLEGDKCKRALELFKQIESRLTWYRKCPPGSSDGLVSIEKIIQQEIYEVGSLVSTPSI
ncbi:hypothetical protein PVAP13_8KG007700 [Panicum virgatum]|uniref:VWFA domain-containing protein n=1 Tax=Panicum virgatum TaxID=38727 RepID=A0A8T0PD25_PANVG|nr:hypothetical protein PVAP13_8KG007700 [Panicum virgatum]